MTDKEILKLTLDDKLEPRKIYELIFSEEIPHSIPPEIQELWNRIWEIYRLSDNYRSEEYYQRIVDLHKKFEQFQIDAKCSVSFGCGCCGGGLILDEESCSYEAPSLEDINKAREAIHRILNE